MLLKAHHSLARNLKILSQHLLVFNTACMLVMPIVFSLAACQPKPPHFIFTEGQLAEGYELGVSTSNGLSNWVELTEGGICMDYPKGQDWGTVFITVGNPVDSPRPSQDFSDYKHLSLDLKGRTGGETLLIALKDSSDPDDGTETSVRASDLTTSWQNFEFDLQRFSNADLEQIYVVTEFIFNEMPQTVCFRNIRYLP